MHKNSVFYVELLSDVEVRNRIDTPKKCQEIIDQMEEFIPHDELPPCYDFLVQKRNHILTQAGLEPSYRSVEDWK